MYKKITNHIICLLALLTFFNVNAQNNKTYSLKGKIVDIETNEPIPNVELSIDSLNLSTLTNESGTYVIENIPAGSYKVKAKGLAFEEQNQTIDINNISSNLNFVLKEEVVLLDEIVITATRTERNAEEVPIPVTVISKEQINNMGSMRLSDVLNEQTGLTINSDHGTGVQLQGYDSDYTLIMINGQPLIGRTSGTFDLDRVTINNIKQIEVTKGPSSSLYGNEALAGVINIITEDPEKPINIELATKYRTYNTSDITLHGSSKNKKTTANVQLNRYASAGYDINPETISQTTPAFDSYTFNTQLGYEYSDKIDLKLQGRFYNENQDSKSTITDDKDLEHIILTDANQNDWSIAPSMIYKPNVKTKINVINYSSGYNTKSDYTYDATGEFYEYSFFNQLYNKSEVQADIRINNANVLCTGAGLIIESLDSDRYIDLENFYTRYVFLQNEWTPFNKKLNVTLGGRFDSHSEYSSQLSPKLAIQYKAKKWVTVRGAFGTGFKAPDFRQLFLDFTNPTVGYSVLGSSFVAAGMQELESTGQIQSILIDYNTIEGIKAESSTSYNVGFDLKPKKNIKIRVNLFRNDIKNLIESAPIAIKTNGQQVYSYFNLSNVYTRGLETSLNWKMKKNISIAVGYQYLEAKDKSIIKDLEKGNIFARDESNQVVRVAPSAYGGLFNRSKHSGNAKIFYKNLKHKFNINARTVYRGSYGYADNNSNGILDTDGEYIDGYFTWHVAASKHLLKEDRLTIQAGIDNLFAYTNEFVPTLPGRLVYVGMKFRFSKS